MNMVCGCDGIITVSLSIPFCDENENENLWHLNMQR
jgi:hypothetical protein